MHRYAAGSDPVDDLTQPLPHPMRRAGTGFLDVDGPGFVQAVGKVDLYPRQLGGLALRHERSEEHTSELQSLMRISYAVFCLKKKNTKENYTEQLLKTNTI